ncbi:glycosyltransferase [Duganella sp. FT94W]|uniref:Glycosyltransferase n=1 Tax=Duganella lactea TaxID=2692173 RepID=A0ABW9VCU7_9BURK|nr:glycosyltransferase family 2 protein [Duganella lactea]MYM36645.1 glycosyltransferase [Duganella lactea]
MSDTDLPLVSILLPTHNRPDYAELALRSALAQNYPNLEIIVSDNSDDELTRERLAPYVAQYPQLRYHRIPSCPPMANFQNCYAQARGEFVNFLMDDDLFHPAKIARMMIAMLSQPDVGVISSSRQLIDGNGQPLPAPPHLAPLFQTDTWVSGQSLGSHLAAVGNVLGEPTTALFRKAAAGPVFGVYQGRQYSVSSDAATWLTILTTQDCIYLHEPLSFFRIHNEQDQRNSKTQVRGQFEALDLVIDLWEHGHFLPSERLRPMLGERLVQCATLLHQARDILRDPVFQPERLATSMQRATALLLS